MAFIQNSQEYLRKIDEEVARLHNLRAQVAAAIQGEAPPETAPRSKRSDAVRERMASAQKARWAQKKAAGKKGVEEQIARSAGTKTATKRTRK